VGGYYTQVTPQLVAEGSPYGVPHPYGVPIPAAIGSRPPTPSERGSQGQAAFSSGGLTPSQRKGRRGGGAEPSSSRGQAASEARSSDSTQPQSQSYNVEGGFRGGRLREAEESGDEAGLMESGSLNRHAEHMRRFGGESSPAERVTSSILSGGGLGHARPSNSYLRHSVTSLPDRYQVPPVMVVQRQRSGAAKPSQSSARLSALAPKPISVQQAPPQRLLDNVGQAQTHINRPKMYNLWPGSDRDSSPRGPDTGGSTVSNVQPELQRPPADTQSEGASTTPEAGRGLRAMQSNLSGGASSSLSTQLPAPPPVGTASVPNPGKLWGSAGFGKMLSEGQKPTVESVNAYRDQQQEQLESLERAGLKGSEVYNMWEEIMKENYRVGIALATMKEGQGPKVRGAKLVCSRVWVSYFL
jgi:hypothetical protein